MHYLLTLILIAIVCFNLGFWGRRLAHLAPVWLVLIGFLFGGAVMLFVNSAQAIPADAETFSQPAPVEYRPCKHITDSQKWDAFARGLPALDANPLPPSCVLPLPMQPADVAPVETKKPTHFLRGLNY